MEVIGVKLSGTVKSPPNSCSTSFSSSSLGVKATLLSGWSILRLAHSLPTHVHCYLGSVEGRGGNHSDLE